MFAVQRFGGAVKRDDNSGVGGEQKNATLLKRIRERKKREREEAVKEDGAKQPKMQTKEAKKTRRRAAAAVSNVKASEDSAGGDETKPRARQDRSAKADVATMDASFADVDGNSISREEPVQQESVGDEDVQSPEEKWEENWDEEEVAKEGWFYDEKYGWYQQSEEAKDKADAGEDAVPYWMRTATTLDGVKLQPLTRCTFLNEVVQQNLHAIGVESLFPVQSQVIPAMLSHQSRDICVAAPTGSGKTLAYTIPIVQALMDRIIPRLRALVILPSRDLVLQVKEVFDQLVVRTNLNVETALGQTVMQEEQARLVKSSADGGELLGGACVVDVLIATPGRLLDHLTSTPGFTLQHVQYLVIDESDRLLRQSYQDWVAKVLAAIHSSAQGRIVMENGRFTFDAVTCRPPAVSSEPANGPPVRKLLFSATLTKNPEKLLSLQLKHPLHFSASNDGRYKTPDTLKEFLVCCDAGQKPLVLMYLLQHVRHRPTLTFTSSITSTHRLHLLLHLYGGMQVAEFSSNLSQEQRTKILSDFRNARLTMLICSDAMTRGIDVDGVTTVINYDAPMHARTYVHRAGRTARAGREGEVYTLVTRDEIKPFKSMLRKCDNNFVQPFYIPPPRLNEFAPRYEECLEDLKRHVQAETNSKPDGNNDNSMVSSVDDLKRQIVRQLQRNLLRAKQA